VNVSVLKDILVVAVTGVQMVIMDSLTAQVLKIRLTKSYYG
jgi:hypothetical protein